MLRGVWLSLKNRLFHQLVAEYVDARAGSVWSLHLSQKNSSQENGHISIREADLSKKCSFFEHCSKGPPPFYLNICPILQGVFFKRVFAGGVF